MFRFRNRFTSRGERNFYSLYHLRPCSHITKFKPVPIFPPILYCIMAHLYYRRRTRVQIRTLIPVLYTIGTRDQSLSLCNVNMFCTMQCSQWVWNVNLSLYPSPSPAIKCLFIESNKQTDLCNRLSLLPCNPKNDSLEYQCVFRYM